jgi:hypothetical protein
MPGLYKIGHTFNSPHQRAQQLSRATSVPEEFSVVGYIEIENPEKWERIFHGSLERFRSNDRREFFRCDLSDIAPLFLMNEYACATVDINFQPAIYPVLVTDLPNPYPRAVQIHA